MSLVHMRALHAKQFTNIFHRILPQLHSQRDSLSESCPLTRNHVCTHFQKSWIFTNYLRKTFHYQTRFISKSWKHYWWQNTTDKSWLRQEEWCISHAGLNACISTLFFLRFDSQKKKRFHDIYMHWKKMSSIEESKTQS